MLPHLVDQIGDGLRAGLRVRAAPGKGRPVLQAVSLRQIAEGKFSAYDDHIPLLVGHHLLKFLVQLLKLFFISRGICLVYAGSFRVQLLKRVRDLLHDHHGVLRRGPDMLVILDLLLMAVIPQRIHMFVAVGTLLHPLH